MSDYQVILARCLPALVKSLLALNLVQAMDVRHPPSPRPTYGASAWPHAVPDHMCQHGSTPEGSALNGREPQTQVGEVLGRRAA